jgi:hypothetical protein
MIHRVTPVSGTRARGLRWSATVVAAAAVVALAAGPALADSWATGTWANGPKDFGSAGTIKFSCLYSPSTSTNFSNDEMWNGTDNSGGGSYWVEEGGSYGYPQGNNRYWFWADNRPSYGYYEHDSADGSAVLNTSYDIEFTYNGSNQWIVWWKGSELGKSTSNPPNGEYLQAGGEHTSSSGRTVGTASSLSWTNQSYGVHGGWTASGYSNPGKQTSGGSATWNSNYTSVSWNSNNC